MSEENMNYNASVLVQLDVLGNFDPQEFSVLSGLQPTYIKQKGSVRAHGTRPIPRKDIWTLRGEINYGDFADVGTAVENFIDMLKPFEERLSAACRKCEVEVFLTAVVWFVANESVSTPSIAISPACNRFMSTLGAWLDVDMYLMSEAGIKPSSVLDPTEGADPVSAPAEEGVSLESDLGKKLNTEPEEDRESL